jgi:hypothetical protein
LKWLKLNNELYTNVTITQLTQQQSELMCNVDEIRVLDSKSETKTNEVKSKEAIHINKKAKSTLENSIIGNFNINNKSFISTQSADKSLNVAFQFCIQTTIHEIDSTWNAFTLDQILFNGKSLHKNKLKFKSIKI